MAPPLRNNPYTLCKNIDRLASAGRVRNRPAWYKAVSMYPPARFVPKGVNPVEVGQFQPVTIGSAHATSAIQQQPKDLYKRGNPRTYRPQYVSSVPLITYPEDELRQAFYRWHPLELHRPRTLVEDENTLRRKDWSTIWGGKHADGTPAKVHVTGESVVQHTLYLMQRPEKLGGPLIRHEAYQEALRAFYAAREQLDQAAQVRREQMQLAAETAAKEEEAQLAMEQLEKGEESMEAVDLPTEQDKADKLYWAKRPKTARFVEWENEQLAESAEYEEEQRAARSMQEEMRRRMEQYEKRNLGSDMDVDPSAAP
ncbi:mitochondrial ribosomal protein S25-domain-containing protein [Powellomyces hirtus]|nr:mitochondrial ribosomal protein S25-domain-containing protein [Powellomyces hirtus]